MSTPTIPGTTYAPTEIRRCRVVYVARRTHYRVEVGPAFGEGPLSLVEEAFGTEAAAEEFLTTLPSAFGVERV